MAGLESGTLMPPQPIPTSTKVFSYQDIGDMVDTLKLGLDRPQRIIAIARGGVVPALMLAQRYGIPHKDVYIRKCSTYKKGVKVREAQFNPQEFPGWMNSPTTLVVDDILDTGSTISALREILPWARFTVLVDKSPMELNMAGALRVTSAYTMGNHKWVVFPWESEEDAPDKRFIPPETGSATEQQTNPQVVSKWGWQAWSDKLHAWFMTKMGIFHKQQRRSCETVVMDARTAELVFLALEYGGEVGEALNFVKKLWRDGFKNELVQGFVKELADSKIMLYHLEDWVKAYVVIRGDESFVFDGDQNAADKLKELFERWPHIAEAVGYTKANPHG